MWSSCAEIPRRTVLRWTVASASALLLGPEHLFAALDRLVPEHSSADEEVLFVYDQCAADHLLREMVQILRHLPPEVRCHVLVSSPRIDEARRRLGEFGLPSLVFVDGGADSLSGLWGRDIFQLGTDSQGVSSVFVPWDKAATMREGLEGTLKILQGLASEHRNVVQLPVAAEGGNLLVDRHDGRDLLFAGSTVAVETRALYRTYYGIDPGDDGVADILCDALGCDEVIWIGPRDNGELTRQSPFLFHIDMGMTIVAPGVAVVGQPNPENLAKDDHRILLEAEAERTVQALRQREIWPDDLELPADPMRRADYLEVRLAEERTDLFTAASELEAMASTLSSLGYEVRRVPASPRCLRRFQSHTNVLPMGGRILMPIYPTDERVHGWILRQQSGRDRVEVALGIQDSDYELSGDNLSAYRLYSELTNDLRTVRDYFYLAGGNVHCVVGRLG